MAKITICIFSGNRRYQPQISRGGINARRNLKINGIIDLVHKVIPVNKSLVELVFQSSDDLGFPTFVE